MQSFHKSVGATVLSKDDKLGFEVVQFSKGTVKEKAIKTIQMWNMQSRITTFTPFGLRTIHIIKINMDYKNSSSTSLG